MPCANNMLQVISAFGLGDKAVKVAKAIWRWTLATTKPKCDSSQNDILHFIPS